jgi:hypothetical protein
VRSIDSNPNGTVGSATEAVGSTVAVCKLPANHYSPDATVARIKSLCAQR